MMNAVIFHKPGKSQEYCHLMKVPEKYKFIKSMTNEIVLIFQFISNIKFTDNLFFVHRNEIPQDSKATYFLIVYNIRPHRKETH